LEKKSLGFLEISFGGFTVSPSQAMRSIEKLTRGEKGEPDSASPLSGDEPMILSWCFGRFQAAHSRR
jgi:hypothetical protein